MNHLRYRIIGLLLLFIMGVGGGMPAFSQDQPYTQHLPLLRTPHQLPTILNFTSDNLNPDPGDTITLSWASQHVSGNTLWRVYGGQISEIWGELPASGTLTYTIPTHARNDVQFTLNAYQTSIAEYDSRQLIIPLTCPTTWFFDTAPNTCPANNPDISLATEQHFEGGIMLWVQTSNQIIILYDDDTLTTPWDNVDNPWQEGDPINNPDITPPDGFYQPTHGFGEVWRDQPFVRDRLGWAIAPEAEFETARQTTAFSRYNSTYYRAQDGNVWHLFTEHSNWEKIGVTGVGCPENWFFAPPPAPCPRPEIPTQLAMQSFEHGTMVWNEENGLIYVLYDTFDAPSWQSFSDDWQDGDPINDPDITPPAGLYQPERGFGKVWRENATVRENLGWATEVEVGYAGIFQPSYRARFPDIYLSQPNNGTWGILYPYEWVQH